MILVASARGQRAYSPSQTQNRRSTRAGSQRKGFALEHQLGRLFLAGVFATGLSATGLVEEGTWNFWK